MDILVLLLTTLIPLYLMIPLGYLGRKVLGIQKESIASLLIYFIAPVVIFTGIITTNITFGMLTIPIVVFLVCTIISLSTFFLGKSIWQDATKNVFGFGAGSANTGYFGVPVAIALFGSNVLGLVALTVVGTALFANTIGFYMVAKGHHSTKESLIKLFKLPILYALLLGIIINLSGIEFGDWFLKFADNFTGAFVILGMMLIGISLADIKKISFDFRYHLLSLLTKFIIWPALMLLVIYIDDQTLHLYSEQVVNVLLLISITPIAVNTVMYATILKTYPDKVAMDVLISTLFALVYIPLIIGLFN